MDFEGDQGSLVWEGEGEVGTGVEGREDRRCTELESTLLAPLVPLSSPSEAEVGVWRHVLLSPLAVSSVGALGSRPALRDADGGA